MIMPISLVVCSCNLTSSENNEIFRKQYIPRLIVIRPWSPEIQGANGGATNTECENDACLTSKLPDISDNVYSGNKTWNKFRNNDVQISVFADRAIVSQTFKRSKWFPLPLIITELVVQTFCFFFTASIATTVPAVSREWNSQRDEFSTWREC